MNDEALPTYARVTIIAWDANGLPASVVDFPKAMSQVGYPERDLRGQIAPVTMEALHLDRVAATILGTPADPDFTPVLTPGEVVRFLKPTEDVLLKAVEFRRAFDAKIAGDAP